MTQEDKELLLKDLSARVPYGVKIEGYELPCIILNSDWLHFMYTHQEFAIRRPYLRPLSSMTEEERNEWASGSAKLTLDIFKKKVSDEMDIPDASDSAFSIDWLNAHHFDYRGLIPLGLAIDVTTLEDNPYNDEFIY